MTIRKIRISYAALLLATISIVVSFLVPGHSASAAQSKSLELLFTEGSGSLVHDSSGNGINATISGAQWSRTSTGKAVLNFNGTSDSLNCAYSSLLNISGATASVTLEAWVNLSQTKNAMWLGTASNGSTGGYLLWYDQTYYNQVVGSLEQPGGWVARAYGSTPLATGAWHHVVYSFDGTYARTYIDGVLNSTSGAWTWGMSPTNQAFAVYPGFAGQIGKIAVYNYALTPSQISNIYSSELGNYAPGQAPSTVQNKSLELLFSEGSGSLVHDSSGNGINATISGAQWSRTSTGKAVLNFNGTSNSLNCAYSSLLNISGATASVTLEAWVNLSQTKNAMWLGTASNGSTGGYLLWYDQTYYNQVTGSLEQPGGWVARAYGTTPLGTGAWHHVVYSFDGTYAKTYIDGVLNSTSGAWTWGMSPTNQAFGVYSGFAGQIGKIAVYNYALTPSQISNLYSSEQANYAPGQAPPAALNKSLELLFTEGSGTLVHDSSGNGINATISGAQWTTTSTGKAALNFNGTSDSLNCAYSSLLNISGATASVTLEAWVNLSQTRNAMWLGTASNGSTGGYLLWYDQTYYNQVTGSLEQPSGWVARAYGSTPLGTGAWHHVVYSFDGTYARTYIDGVLNSTSGAWTWGMSPTNQAFAVYPGFAGQIGKIAVYNYALTPSQISNIYSSELGNYAPGQAPSTVQNKSLELLFSEGSGSLVHDSSGNGINATISGAQWSRTSTGKAVLNFNGTSNSLNCAYSSLLNISGATASVTLEAWVNLSQTKNAMWLGTASNGSTGGYLLWYDQTYYNQVTGSLEQPGGWVARAYGTTPLGTGAWHHVVYSFDGTYAKTYIDGVLNSTSSAWTWGMSPTNQAFGVYSGFAGQIGKIAVYNYALTLSQISNLYSSEQANYAPGQAAPAVQNKSLELLFSEGSGSLVHDSSGNGINATISGAQWTTTSTGKAALNFNGTSNSLNCAYSSLLNISGATASVTLEAWVNLSQTRNAMWLGTASNGSTGGYLLWYDQTYYNQVVGSLEQPGGWVARAYGSTPLATGTWHHVVYSFDGTYARTYIDGVLNSTSGAWTWGISSTNQPFGVYPGFSGQIGKIAIYNYTLTPSQISSLYSSDRGNYYSVPTSTTLYVYPAMSTEKVLPATIISSQYISNQLSLSGAPGESKSATFVIRPINDVSSLTPIPSNLTGSAGTIDQSSLNIRVVKTWYQAGVGIADTSNKVLTPELLLKDDSLIKVENGENYVKLTDGSYKWISDPTSYPTQNAEIPVSALSIKDTSTLQPANIPASTNKQFWITLKIPPTANPGTYSGQISLSSPSGSLGQFQITLQVLPINLADSYLTYGLFYRGFLNPGWPQGSISGSYKSETQLTAELQDMLDHGIKNPTVSQSSDTTYLNKVYTIRQNLGISNQNIYFMGLAPWGYENVSQVQQVIAFSRNNYGTQNVYFYGADEATGTALTAQRSSWQNIRAAGGKIFAAGWTNLDQVFPAMGDILDAFVYGRPPLASEAAKWHSLGHQIYSYNNPVAGVEDPSLNRKNYGLLLWQNDYDGSMDFAYQCDYGNIWNDFDWPAFRDHVLAYPTIDGVIDTIEWEGMREAVNDIRYLTTLFNSINNAKSIGRDTSAAAAWLANLKSADLTTLNLDDVRSQMVSYILALR